MKQNFIQTATGERLDYWGQIFAVSRSEGEADDTYRERLLGGVSNRLAVGTKNAYKDKIMESPIVLDALVENTADDVGILAGTIRLTVLTSDVDFTELQKLEIVRSLQTNDFGMVGDEFVFRNVDVLPIDGEITIYKNLDVDSEQLRDGVDGKIEEYFSELKSSFGREFGKNDLERKLLQIEGISRVHLLTFENIPVLDSGAIHSRGNIQINIL